jgi:hypothetical protein
VNVLEILFAGLLVLVLCGAAGYYAWRQRQTLRALRTDDSLGPLERAFLRRQVRRRLLVSGLMVIFAGLLIGPYFLDLRPPDRGQAEQAPPSAEQRQFLWLFASYWILFLILFLAIICLALIDLLATRRFTLRRLRQLNDQHQAFLDRHAGRLFGRRNGD